MCSIIIIPLVLNDLTLWFQGVLIGDHEVGKVRDQAPLLSPICIALTLLFNTQTSLVSAYGTREPLVRCVPVVGAFGETHQPCSQNPLLPGSEYLRMPGKLNIELTWRQSSQLRSRYKFT